MTTRDEAVRTVAKAGEAVAAIYRLWGPAPAAEMIDALDDLVRAIEILEALPPAPEPDPTDDELEALEAAGWAAAEQAAIDAATGRKSAPEPGAEEAFMDAMQEHIGYFLYQSDVHGVVPALDNLEQNMRQAFRDSLAAAAGKGD